MGRKILKISLVGCGRIAQRHSGLLGKGLISGARLAAVCDINKEKAEAMGKSYGVPCYEDFNQMMCKEDIDVVSVLTPSGLHAEHVIALTKYGKHIIVEKPMALTLDSADDMIKACDANACRLFVIKQNRFNIPVLIGIV